MANLAIRGNVDYGNEVIKILEMLGGINKFGTSAYKENNWFFINEKRGNAIEKVKFNGDISVYWEYYRITFEEFIEKYPFKIGDNILIDSDKIGNITKMKWNGTEVIYTCNVDNQEKEYKVLELKPYKDIETLENNVYPEEYYTCYENLFINEISINGVNEGLAKLFIDFIKLKQYRDAYWKLVNYDGLEICKHHIGIKNGIPYTYDKWTTSSFLRFPNRSMRTFFFEKFKPLIEECKELLY